MSEENGKKEAFDKWYEQRRAHLLERRHTYALLVDKSLLTYSAGAFGISLVFLENIVGSAPHQILWLIIAWTLLVTCMLSVLAGTWMTRESYQSAVDNHDEYYETGTEVPPKYGTMINVANWLSIAAFVSGLVALAIFATVNLGGSDMAKKDEVVTPQQEREGKVEKPKGEVPSNLPRNINHPDHPTTPSDNSGNDTSSGSTSDN